MSKKNFNLNINKESTNEQIKNVAFELLENFREVTLATVNNNKPAARTVIILKIDSNENNDKIYFMTEKGKPMSKQIKINPHVSVLGESEDIMVRVEGKAKFTENIDYLLEIIEGQEGMFKGKEDILEMFYIESASGEVYDVRTRKPKRMRFSFGDSIPSPYVYKISENCISCGTCKDSCVTGAIYENKSKYTIDYYYCGECGRCYEKCPNNAIRAEF
ncbi:MAG: 4Fe-4S binding protein [Methanobacteriaceae archaeon]